MFHPIIITTYAMLMIWMTYRSMKFDKKAREILNKIYKLNMDDFTHGRPDIMEQRYQMFDKLTPFKAYLQFWKSVDSYDFSPCLVESVDRMN